MNLFNGGYATRDDHIDPDDILDAEICRACAVEHNIAREKRWSSLGKCAICQEQHILFMVTSDNPGLDVANALMNKHPSLLPEDAVFYAS